MKVLILTYDFPYPTNSGGKSRIYNLIKFSKSMYFDKKVEDKLLDIIQKENIDTVLFESFYTSFYISEKIRKLGVKQIFGTENIEHILYYDFAKEKNSIIRKPFMTQVGRVRREEERAYEKSD